MASGGVSGSAVAVATLGGVLIYAGFRGVTPLQALRDATGGHPPPVEGHAATESSQGLSGLADSRRATVVSTELRGRHVQPAPQDAPRLLRLLIVR